MAKPLIKDKHKRRYLILPMCLLLLNAVEEIVMYKSVLITNPYLRTLAMLALYTLGVALMAYLVAPQLERLLVFSFRTSKSNAGRVGEAALLGVIAIALYWLYFTIYVNGPQVLLPEIWHNPK